MVVEREIQEKICWIVLMLIPYYALLWWLWCGGRVRWRLQCLSPSSLNQSAAALARAGRPAGLAGLQSWVKVVVAGGLMAGSVSTGQSLDTATT